MFNTYLKKRNVKKYVKKLPARLKKLYGKNKYYTKAQVDRAIRETRCSTSDVCYAYAIYVSPEEFDHIHRVNGEQCDYGAMRNEIGDICFKGESNFTATELVDSASSESGFFSGFGGDVGDAGFSGGDAGGGGGGD